MLLGLHTYSFYLHGIGQAWADFKLPWPRQMNTFELFDEGIRMGLDGFHLDDGVLESLDPSYLKEVREAAHEKGLYLEYNFSMDLGGMGIGIQHDLNEAIATAENLGSDTVNALMVMEDPMQAIANLAPRAFTNHFRDDRIELQRYGFKLTGAAVGEGDIDMRRAYEIFRTTSSMRRINIETEMEIPLDNMAQALRMEKENVERSIRYCREVLGIKKEGQVCTEKRGDAQESPSASDRASELLRHNGQLGQV